MRWTRQSRVIAVVAVVSATGIAWGTLWWFGWLPETSAPPDSEPEAALPGPPPEPAEAGPEVFSPYHLPGSWCFEELDAYKTLPELVERKRADVTASLTPALEEILVGKRPIETCVLEVRWTESGKGTSVTIHGDGLGIHWQGKQFQVPTEQRLELLGKLKAAQFLSMPDHLGRAPRDADPLREQDGSRAQGRISLRIGKESKIVEYHNESSSNDDFVRLAKDLLTACLKHAASGIGASSLEDGLQKVLDRKLDVRALQVEVGFGRPAHSTTFQIEGLLARISGQTYVSHFRGQKLLTAEDLPTFIKTIQREKFQSLEFLHSGFDHFMTIKVRVLNREHSISHLPYHSEYSLAEELRRWKSVQMAVQALEPERVYDKTP